MIQKAKKKSLFLLGLFFSGVLGSIIGHMNSSYSKDDSLFVSSVHADVTNFTTAVTYDGCGGCSGGDSY